ncbi:hypothetical protein [Edaphobacter aggregans]|uniref:hypothetical protein n=1 Tax=Edaphobacter aggregans TaxID=570835 RepID=UPI00054F627B|nr:hypothetical protein [Edaphobacter aggregans]
MNRTVDNDSNQGVRAFVSAHSDEYFIELCALSTTDALKMEEWRQLELHLSICASCREIKAQYDAVIATTIPAMAANQVPAGDDHPSDSWSIEQAQASLMARIEREDIFPEKDSQSPMRTSKGQGLSWPYLGAAVFMVASFCLGYRIGILRGHSSTVVTVSSPLPIDKAQPDLNHVNTAYAPTPRKNEQRAENTADLRRQLQERAQEIAQLKGLLPRLKDELADRTSALDRNSQDRAALERQLLLAQTNAQSLEDRLKVAASQNSQGDAQAVALQARVNELTDSMRDKDRQISKHQEMLEHDRDIRNLVGARDLYIAEIYDVAKTGETQKPFGRVFYTKGKSLVFYAYDLDQQPGVKLASTFQAWGRKGIDQQHDINLGIFYQDDQNKKRWILKSNDPTTLAQIDAVFVTVEPDRESSKPSGKPLLFTYLRLTPNHP